MSNQDDTFDLDNKGDAMTLATTVGVMRGHLRDTGAQVRKGAIASCAAWLRKQGHNDLASDMLRTFEVETASKGGE